MQFASQPWCGCCCAQVQLQAMPMQRGLYHLSGCRTTVLAVTWSQPWTPNPPSLGVQLQIRHHD